MNADTMGKELGPVADDIAMFLSGIDGFPHDLRDFSAVGAGTWMGIAFVHEPEGRLLHSFGKHINNMLWHDSFDPGIRGIHGSLCTLFMMVAIKAISTGRLRWPGGTMLACTAIRGCRGFKVAKVHVTGCTGFRGFGEVAVCAGLTIWFVVHFLFICFLMVSITHRVNMTNMHRAIAPLARMSVILTNSVMVSQSV